MAITYDTGIGQALKYGTSSADTYAGRVTGGALRGDARHVWRPSIGGKHASGRGIWNGGGSATIEIADATLINYAKRSSYTSPALTALIFEGSCYDTGGNVQGWTQSGCAINSLEVSLGVNDPLTAAIEWLASSQADNAAPTAPTTAATHFEWFNGGCTIFGGTYGLQSMRIRLNNNLEPISSIETKSPGSLVLPEDFRIGKETVSFEASMYTFPGTSNWNLHGDTGVAGAAAVLTATTGGHTITFTLANMNGTVVEMPFEGDDGAVQFRFTGECEPNASNSLTIAYS